MDQRQQQDPDFLYQEYDKNLYRITGTEMSDDIINMLNADPSANNSSMVSVPADSLGSGIDTSTTSAAAGSSYQGGKQTFDNTHAGYILGLDQKDGLAKFYIGNTTAYINWDGATLTVVGGVNISSLNIPDQTTANSFHVDSQGNAWWGANVATGYAGAPASITAAGLITGTNAVITGTINATGGYIGTTTALVYEAQGINTGITGHIRGGQTDYNTGTGYFLGYSGAAYKLSLGSPTGNRLTWDGMTLTIAGTFQTWQGGGDGSDGVVNFDGTNTFSFASTTGVAPNLVYTLTRDILPSNFIVASGITLNVAGYATYTSGPVNISGTVQSVGSNGSNGIVGSASGGGAGGAGGAGAPGGSFPAGTAGAAGGLGATNDAVGGAGGNGSNLNPALGVSGAAGGTGGTAGGNAGGTAGTAGTATGETLRVVQGVNTLPFTVAIGTNSANFTRFIPSGATSTITLSTSAGSGGGGGGSGKGNQFAGGGGGAGGSGGVVFISGYSITVNASGVIKSAGGTGGNGGPAFDFDNNNPCGGGAGGGGGPGGPVILFYSSAGGLTNNGTISAPGGTGGTGGAPVRGGGTGGTGPTGTAGNIYKLKVTL